MFKRIFLFIFLLTYSLSTLAQTPFPNPGKVFNDELIPKVYIEIDPGDLAELFNTLENESHYPATFIFDNGNNRDTLLDVGFRLRGNTSLFSQKKSFKISFNTFEPGRKYKGLEKLNINGEHNDPSIIRSKLGWNLCREMKIPASRSNHVELYLNDEYYGLYINVEHIDEEFVQLRFGQEVGNLYKCLWPSTLEYLGTNPDAYKFQNNGVRVYDLKTNTTEDDYSDIANFIDVLNNTPSADFQCELEKVFDVQNYLKVIAMDVLIANWDGPIFNKNNFYLYNNPQSGKIQYIPFDLDNTFGIRWFGEWVNRNIYTWSPGGEPRPIYTKIMANPTYRAQYSYYVDQFLELYFNETNFFDLIDSTKNRIEPSVSTDPIYPLDYGFDIDDFNNSYTEGLSVNHVPIGLKEFIIGRRASALNQLETTNASPIISTIQNQIGNANQDIFIGALIEDEGTVAAKVEYSFNGQTWQNVTMFDDGQHNDGIAGDQIYGAKIDAFNDAGTMEYYISANDIEGNNNRFPFCETFEIMLENPAIELYINEFQADNESTIADEANEFDDWIELYNASNQNLDLDGFYLSDDLDDPLKWALPSASIQSGEFLLVWADDDTDQGEYHANFKLSASGEEIVLSNATGNTIDYVSFGVQGEDEATGRIPNGIGIMQLVIPTPGASNVPLVSTQIIPTPEFDLSPNPFQHKIRIASDEQIEEVQLYNLLGQLIQTQKVNSATIEINTPKLDAGIYFLQIEFANGWIGTRKVIKV